MFPNQPTYLPTYLPTYQSPGTRPLGPSAVTHTHRPPSPSLPSLPPQASREVLSEISKKAPTTLFTTRSLKSEKAKFGLVRAAGARWDGGLVHPRWGSRAGVAGACCVRWGGRGLLWVASVTGRSPEPAQTNLGKALLRLLAEHGRWGRRAVQGVRNWKRRQTRNGLAAPRCVQVECLNHGLLNAYPVSYEKPDALVAQVRTPPPAAALGALGCTWGRRALHVPPALLQTVLL